MQDLPLRCKTPLILYDFMITIMLIGSWIWGREAGAWRAAPHDLADVERVAAERSALPAGPGLDAANHAQRPRCFRYVHHRIRTETRVKEPLKLIFIDFPWFSLFSIVFH